MKIYLSGKISGLSEKEYTENFENAKFSPTIEKHYAKIFYNPCEIKPLFGIKKYWCFMAADLYTLIFKCDAIYLLDNWKDSKGAKIELFFALLTRKRVL